MPDRTKTLVILSPAFPESETPSNWVLSQQLFVKTLKEQYPELNIILFSFFYPKHTGIYDWHGIQVQCFDGTHKRGLRRLLLWKDIWLKLRTVCRQNDVAGIFSFWCGECALLGSWFGRLHSIKHYCWICGQDARKGNRLVKFIRPRPQELVAMSPFLAGRFHRSHGILPQHIIPNAIDSRQFPAPLPAARDIDLLGVGSLEPLKQYRLFVSIVQSLQQRLPSINALICGSGPEKAVLEALIKEKGLEKNIRLSDLTPHDEVLRLMQRAKIVLHPSAYEGFSTVCLEAAYAGAQVISFCHPMGGEIPHWQIARHTSEMTCKTLALLQSPRTDHTPVLAHEMKDSVTAVMKLFGW